MKVAYIDGQAYAGGIANGRRTAAMAKALRSTGFEVVKMEHDSYVSPRWMRALGRLSRFAGFLRLQLLALGSAVPEWLSKERPDVVVLYGTDVRFVLRTIAWSRKNGVPLIAEIVDWYRPKDVHGWGSKIFALLNGRFSFAMLARASRAVVVASNLLRGYFETRNVPALVVPAVMDLELRSVVQEEVSPLGRRMKVAYVGAGNARERELLSNLDRLANSGLSFDLPVQINLAGGSAASPQSGGDGLSLVGHGPLDPAAASALVRASDFTVLQRRVERFANAGFPSKVAESLINGTPVICNITSDLSEYVSDGDNAIIIGSERYEDLLDGIERAVSAVERGEMLPRSEIADRARADFGAEAVGSRLGPFLREHLGEIDEVTVDEACQ